MIGLDDGPGDGSGGEALQVVTVTFEVRRGTDRYEIEEALRGPVRVLGGGAIEVAYLLEETSREQRPEVPDDTSVLTEGVRRANRPGVIRSLIDQGTTSAKAVACIGGFRLAQFPNIGDKAVEVISENLESIIGEPLKPRPTVEDVARYCNDLSEVPIQVLLGYGGLPGMSAIYDDRTQTSRQVHLSVLDALSQSPTLRTLAFRWNKEIGYSSFSLPRLEQRAIEYAEQFYAAKQAQGE